MPFSAAVLLSESAAGLRSARWRAVPRDWGVVKGATVLWPSSGRGRARPAEQFSCMFVEQ
jgi:hypothetical protein